MYRIVRIIDGESVTLLECDEETALKRFRHMVQQWRALAVLHGFTIEAGSRSLIISKNRVVICFEIIPVA